MSIKVLVKRGLNADRLTTMLDEGELYYTIDTKKIYIGDGVTAGGVDPTTISTSTNMNTERISNLIVEANNVLETSHSLGEIPKHVTLYEHISRDKINLGIHSDGTIAGNGMIEGRTFKPTYETLRDSKHTHLNYDVANTTSVAFNYIDSYNMDIRYSECIDDGSCNIINSDSLPQLYHTTGAYIDISDAKNYVYVTGIDDYTTNVLISDSIVFRVYDRANINNGPIVDQILKNIFNMDLFTTKPAYVEYGKGGGSYIEYRFRIMVDYCEKTNQAIISRSYNSGGVKLSETVLYDLSTDTKININMLQDAIKNRLVTGLYLLENETYVTVMDGNNHGHTYRYDMLNNTLVELFTMTTEYLWKTNISICGNKKLFNNGRTLCVLYNDDTKVFVPLGSTDYAIIEAIEHNGSIYIGILDHYYSNYRVIRIDSAANVIDIVPYTKISDSISSATSTTKYKINAYVNNTDIVYEFMHLKDTGYITKVVVHNDDTYNDRVVDGDGNGLIPEKDIWSSNVSSILLTTNSDIIPTYSTIVDTDWVTYYSSTNFIDFTNVNDITHIDSNFILGDGVGQILFLNNNLSSFPAPFDTYIDLDKNILHDRLINNDCIKIVSLGSGSSGDSYKLTINSNSFMTNTVNYDTDTSTTVDNIIAEINSNGETEYGSPVFAEKYNSDAFKIIFKPYPDISSINTQNIANDSTGATLTTTPIQSGNYGLISAIKDYPGDKKIGYSIKLKATTTVPEFKNILFTVDAADELTIINNDQNIRAVVSPTTVKITNSSNRGMKIDIVVSS